MKKKEIKKTKGYSKDHVAILLEDLNSQFKIFGESQQDMKRKVDKLEDRFDKFDIRLSRVEDKIVMNNIRFNSIDLELKRISRDLKDSYESTAEYFSRIEKEIQAVKKEIEKLKTNSKDKVDLKRVEEAEKRIMKIERLVFAKAT